METAKGKTVKMYMCHLARRSERTLLKEGKTKQGTKVRLVQTKSGIKEIYRWHKIQKCWVWVTNTACGQVVPIEKVFETMTGQEPQDNNKTPFL